MEVYDEAKHNARFKEKGCDKPLSKANNQVQWALLLWYCWGISSNIGQVKAGCGGPLQDQLRTRSIIGTTLFFHSEVTVKEKIPAHLQIESAAEQTGIQFYPETKSTKTTIPFVKLNEFDYADLITWIHPGLEKYAWIVFVLAVWYFYFLVNNFFRWSVFTKKPVTLVQAFFFFFRFTTILHLRSMIY